MPDPDPIPLFQQVLEQIKTITRPAKIRQTSVRRLALLVVGILGSRSCTIAQIAAEIDALGLTRASTAASVARRLRRTLNDKNLSSESCYEGGLDRVIDWSCWKKGVVLVVDESSKEEEVHLFRVGLAYQGTTLPLAWAVWEQNQPQPSGDYWKAVDRVLARVAELLPKDLEVIVLADRAYDNPSFIDRIAAYGWHWIVRCRAGGSVRFRDYAGREWGLGQFLEQKLKGPGRRWKGRGHVFKEAGWREVSIVAIWGTDYPQPLVVLTDLSPGWEVAKLYGRRFWAEPGFRNDKSKGWQWEASQVRDVAHHQRLLIAMAWASLIALCLGSKEAKERLAKLAESGSPAKPQHARESIFTIGIRLIRAWLYRKVACVIEWWLTAAEEVSWSSCWYQQQSYRYIFKTVRP